ncbi:unnamed protein product [Pylaiella littoralis]
MADSKRVRISKREGALMARLSAKEQEVYEVQASARDLYRARRPVTDFARQVYTDPAINVEFQLLTAQLAEMENSLRLKESELKELRTTADKADKEKAANSTVKGADGTVPKAPVGGGKSGEGGGAKGESTAARASALVARCQRLEQENEELAASADVAKVAQLTSEKAVAEAYAGELKTALEKAYEYIEQLEEEREVHSNKVYALEEKIRSVASQPDPYDQQQQQHHQQQQQQQRHHHNQHQHQRDQQQQQHHHLNQHQHQRDQQQQQHHQQEQQQQQHHQQEEEEEEEQQQQQRQRQDYHSASPPNPLAAPGEGEGEPSWSEDIHHRQHQQHQEREGGQREGGGGRMDISSASGSDAQPPPPPPPPPPPQPDAESETAAAAGDDMDDLYGDMGDAVEAAYSPGEGEGTEGPVVKDDPMRRSRSRSRSRNQNQKGGRKPLQRPRELDQRDDQQEAAESRRKLPFSSSNHGAHRAVGSPFMVVRDQASRE